MSMKLSTGRVPFPIEFDNGDRQTIYFNPQSKTFREKIFEFEKSVNARITNINIEKYKNAFEDGTSVNVDINDIDAVMNLSSEELDSLKAKADAIASIDNEYQSAIKDELDAIFESPISEVVFKYCQPLDPVVVVDDKGIETTEPFVFQFIKALHYELVKYGEGRTEAIEKYLGKHKK